MLFFPSKNNSLRLVVRAAEEGAAPPATTPVGGEARKAKPPPIGPKRGAKVCFQLTDFVIHVNQIEYQITDRPDNFIA